MIGRKHTEESKLKIGKASKDNQYALGVKHTDETKKKMLYSKQNISQETRNKMSFARIGNKNGVGNKNIFKQPINQLDMENNTIKSWVSITEAANNFNLSISNIYKVCNGKRKTCGGFKWEYKGINHG